MKGNNRDDLMVNDGPSSDSSTELVSPMDNGKKENRRSVHKKMERVDRRLTTESSSSGTSRSTRSNSLTPPRQESTTSSAPPQKTRSKAKAMEESDASGRESRRLTTSSHSPRRSAQANYSRSGNVREARSRDLSVDAATRRSRERSLDAAYRRAQQRSLSKDRSTESHSPRPIRQNLILDSVDTAIQRRAGRKPDPLSSSRHGDPTANQKLGSSTHGGRRRASVPEPMTTCSRGDAESSTAAISTHNDHRQIRRSLSDDHRKPHNASLDSSGHRRPTRKDPLGGSRHGPAHAQSHSRRSHSVEPATAESRGMATAVNQRRAAKKDDVLARSRHGDPTAALTLNTSSHRHRSRSGEHRKQVADSLGIVSQRRAARKDDILGGSIHEPVATTYSQRRPNAATVYTPMTPSTTVKPNVDCFKNLSRLLSDTTISPNKTDHHNPEDGDSNDDHDNQLMDLLTTDMTPKQLRRALRARKKVEDAKTIKQQQKQEEHGISDKPSTTVDPTEMDNLGITLDPSTSFEQNPTSNDVDEHHPTNTTDLSMPRESSMDTDTPVASISSHHERRTTTTTSASIPRPRQFRRHTMDHAPKYHEPELPPLPSSSHGSHFPRSTSIGAIEQDDPSHTPTEACTTTTTATTTTNAPQIVKRRYGKMGEGQLQAIKRDRTSRKQSVKESILSFLDE